MFIKLFMRVLIACFIIFEYLYAQSPDLLNGWPYMFGDSYNIRSTPVFFGNAFNDTLAILFTGEPSTISKLNLWNELFDGWPIREDGARFSYTPIAVDIDHDYKDEFVVLGLMDQYLIYVIDDDRSIMPGFPLAYDHNNLPNVFDFDNDGEYELAYQSVSESLIYCVDGNGQMEPGWPAAYPADWEGFNGRGTIGDINLDGYNEFIITGLKKIYAYQYDGSLLNDFCLETIDTSYYFNTNRGCCCADLDDDGYLEFPLAASKRVGNTLNSYVAIYEHDGQIKDGWPLHYYSSYVWIMPTPSDIDGNGTVEIGYSENSHTHFVDISGNHLAGWPTVIMAPDNRCAYAMSDIIIVDIDGDRDSEIFFGCNFNYLDPEWGFCSYLNGCDHHGQPLEGFPLRIRGMSDYLPPAFLRNKVDGRLLIGISSQNTYDPGVDTAYLEVFQFPDSTGPPDQWPMQGHDNLMTRNYNFVDHVTAIRDDEQPLPKSYILTQNYPNPFNAATTIDFALPKPEHVTITVYDILGRRVEALVDEALPAGNHQVAWQADDYASGIYFYRMEVGDLTLSRKMLLIK